MTVIDSHVHVWDLERAAYPWLGPGLAPIDRTIRLDEVQPSLSAAGVAAVVLVQAADSVADTGNMLRAADQYPQTVAGVVGWVPLDEPDRAAELLDARDRRLVGVRSLIHDQPDPDWILHPAQDEGLGLLERAGLPFDYVTSDPAALRHLPVLADRHPDLPLVLDHLGKPPIGGSAAQRAHWRTLLTAAAENPRLVAKASGLYPSTGRLDDWTPELVRPFLDDALDLFGADRLMYGGDWPVSVLAGGYARTWAALSGWARTLSAAERDAVLGGTAARVYRLAGYCLVAV